MIGTILKIFTVLNALIGIALVAAAAWPPLDPTIEKKPIIVIVFIFWAIFFLGLARVLFYVKPLARKWTFWLYGFASAGTLWLMISDVINEDQLMVFYPWEKSFVYLIFLAFFIWPIVFMLRKDVKDYFIQFEQNRMKADEESARASFRPKK
jgi:hypothetical protein